MPRYNSKLGVWTPANEKAVNVRNGDVYEGPDREAIREMEKNGGTMGTDVRKDADNIVRARQMGMSTEEFLQLDVPPTPEQIKKQEEAKTRVADQMQEKTPGKKRVEKMGGGADTTGQGNDMAGGFGDTPKV